jgi:uncharacterized protein involved in cysteine biosynthesis
MILTDFLKALAQLPDPRFRRVMGLGLALTFAILVAGYAGVLWLIDTFTDDGLSLWGFAPLTGLGDFFSWWSVLVLLLLSIFLMIPVASVITSFFLEDIAQAVEDEHYPHLPPVPRVPFGDAVRDTVNFLGVMLAANIAAIGLYIFLPFLAIPIFYALNGFLLGREYFQIAAMRRLGREGALALRAQNRGTIWLAGCLMAIPLTFPLVNLVIPILGAATFTHLFHRLNRG